LARREQWSWLALVLSGLLTISSLVILVALTWPSQKDQYRGQHRPATRGTGGAGEEPYPLRCEGLPDTVGGGNGRASRRIRTY
jgi:hypothetical protein